jgi:hypothetical protein
MPEVPVSALSFAHQKQVESAQAALDRGQPAQTAALCADLLANQPACLAVRKLERAALLKLSGGSVGGFARTLLTAPQLLVARRQLPGEPRAALLAAEQIKGGHLLRIAPHLPSGGPRRRSSRRKPPANSRVISPSGGSHSPRPASPPPGRRKPCAPPVKHSASHRRMPPPSRCSAKPRSP